MAVTCWWWVVLCSRENEEVEDTKDKMPTRIPGNEQMIKSNSKQVNQAC
jgi:hypothetical protein